MYLSTCTLSDAFRWSQGPENSRKASGWEESQNWWTQREDKLLYYSTAHSGNYSQNFL